MIVRAKMRLGLTLVEMLVVLSILAVLTIVAVQSTDYLVEQARFDATQRTLQNIQDAIVSSGFVADMGRLPQPVYQGGVLAGDPLRELWDASALVLNSGTVYQVQSTSVLSVNVTMPCGWRGPYLQLPVGSSGRLLDGWGNAFHALYQAPGATTAPATPAPGQPINVVASLGADNFLNAGLVTNAYDLDQFVPAQPQAPPTAPLVSFSDRMFGTVTVSVQAMNGNVQPTALTNPFVGSEKLPMVRVALFAPVNGVLTAFALDTSMNAKYNPYPTPATDLANPNPSPSDFAVPPTGSVAGVFVNVPIGPRAVQAFQYDKTTLTVTRRSPLTYITVPASGVVTTLILQ